jgi:hypothetical protein
LEGSLMAREPDNKLLMSIPKGYRGDFLSCLDRSTPVGQAMHERCAMVISDLGGESELATVRRSTARDWAGLDVLVESLFCRVAAGEAVDTGALTQLMNTKTGLARILGLDRRPKQIRKLHDVMRPNP